LAYQFSEDYENAKNYFEMALRIDVNHDPSLYHIGLMQHKLGMLPEALQSFTDVLKSTDKLRIAYEARGLIYQDMKNYVASIEDFNCASEREPDYSEIYYYRGLSKIE